MDRDDLKIQVQELVASFWNQKEEAEIRKSTEKALEDSANTISELTSSLENKTEEAASLEEKLSESESANTELNEKLEAANEELTKTKDELASITQALEDMKKDRAAETRMAELEDAGVANSDRETQTAKVREMNDEDFASYKDELVSIRESVIAELNKAKAEADAKAEEEAKKAEEEAKKMTKKDDEEEDMEDDMKKKKKGKNMKEKCSDSEDASESEDSDDSENASEDNEDETPAPANITPGQAAAAALNFESVPSKDVTKRYQDFGKALAERMAKKWNKSE